MKTKDNLEIGYNRKGFLRAGNQICPNTIPVLVTGTGISNPCSGFSLTGIGNWISPDSGQNLPEFPKN